MHFSLQTYKKLECNENNPRKMYLQNEPRDIKRDTDNKQRQNKLQLENAKKVIK